ncbi:polyhomeotic-like protein 2 [Terrapene carolina triunguis]|uniref:polyhomeotic-like protein 2 n=1 Tax=Terrapene triunguis TaxID=2587831 RepID=UPI00115623E6|nr:polyhomeotic-like protein 2 [Terrapene carolina triunguis]
MSPYSYGSDLGKPGSCLRVPSALAIVLQAEPLRVIQQALHRQPSTAAQYLQQMYAAQQQHLMLQTAALQQQHLSSAQLQSLAAVQQASLAANRQGGSSGSNAPAQTPSQQPTINLATSPAAAQLINRAQSVNSAAASGITQQAVLLGNATSPALTASQAQMYLRAQMLIFTPTATVTAVQPEGSAAPTSQPSTTTAQVQNLAIRAQQTVAQGVASSQAQQLPTLAMKPAPSSSQPASNTSQGKAVGPAPSAGTKGSQAEQAAEHLKKGDGGVPTSMDSRGHPMSRTVTPVTTHPLIAPAYAQLQPHQLIQQQKQIQHQFVIQQQQLQPRPQPQLIQGGANTSPQLQPLPPPTPSLAVQPSPQVQGQSHTAPQGPAPLCHPPPCQASSQHKPSANQPYQPTLHAPGLQAVGPAQPAPEGGPQNGHPGCLNHATQRKFQHASAVILQLQPAIGTPQLSIQENARKDILPADKNPESLPAQQPQPPQAALMPPTAPPDPEVSEGNRPPTHGRPACSDSRWGSSSPAELQVERAVPAQGGPGEGARSVQRGACFSRPPPALGPAFAPSPGLAARSRFPPGGASWAFPQQQLLPPAPLAARGWEAGPGRAANGSARLRGSGGLTKRPTRPARSPRALSAPPATALPRVGATKRGQPGWAARGTPPGSRSGDARGRCHRRARAQRSARGRSRNRLPEAGHSLTPGPGGAFLRRPQRRGGGSFVSTSSDAPAREAGGCAGCSRPELAPLPAVAPGRRERQLGWPFVCAESSFRRWGSGGAAPGRDRGTGRCAFDSLRLVLAAGLRIPRAQRSAAQRSSRVQRRTRGAGEWEGKGRQGAQLPGALEPGKFQPSRPLAAHAEEGLAGEAARPGLDQLPLCCCAA